MARETEREWSRVKQVWCSFLPNHPSRVIYTPSRVHPWVRRKAYERWGLDFITSRRECKGHCCSEEASSREAIRGIAENRSASLWERPSSFHWEWYFLSELEASSIARVEKIGWILSKRDRFHRLHLLDWNLGVCLFHWSTSWEIESKMQEVESERILWLHWRWNQTRWSTHLLWASHRLDWCSVQDDQCCWK